MDPISDLLTRIRNAGMAKHEKVDIPHSRIKEGIASVLKENGFIKNYRVVKDFRQGMMRVYLKYDSAGKPIFRVLKRESRPGLRKYTSAEKIPQVRSGTGLVVMSTSKGVLSGESAKGQNIGGEVLCSIW